MIKGVFRNIFILIFLLVLTAPAFGASTLPLKISTLDANVMPEYDTSDVLAVYSVTFVNTSGQPYTDEIRFPVPKNTTNNVVKETSTSNDIHLEVKVEDKGDYAELVWKPSQPIQLNAAYPIHLEYYYNPLSGTGNKSFTYQLRAIMPVDQAKVYVYQPLKAKNFKMEPAGQLAGQDNQGFQVYSVNYSKLNSGDKVDLKISYTKDDPNPSIQKPGGSPGPAGNDGKLSNTAVIAITIFFAAVVILAIKLFSGNSGTQKGRNHSSKAVSYKTPKHKGGQFLEERKKLRQMLLNGKISEETYHKLVKELEEENS